MREREREEGRGGVFFGGRGGGGVCDRGCTRIPRVGGYGDILGTLSVHGETDVDGLTEGHRRSEARQVGCIESRSK